MFVAHRGELKVSPSPIGNWYDVQYVYDRHSISSEHKYDATTRSALQLGVDIAKQDKIKHCAVIKFLIKEWSTRSNIYNRMVTVHVYGKKMGMVTHFHDDSQLKTATKEWLWV